MFKPDPAQQFVIDHKEGGIAVVAGAGSGKTTVITARVMRIWKENPKSRGLLVSFTRKAAGELADRIRKAWDHSFGSKGEPPPCQVLTLHGFCLSLLERFEDLVEMDASSRILDEMEARLLWKSSLRRLWSLSPEQGVSRSFLRLLEKEPLSSLEKLIFETHQRSLSGSVQALLALKTQESMDLAGVSAWVSEAYSAQKRQMGCMDYGDLEYFADKILSFQNARTWVQKYYEWIILDEFQDTSVQQLGWVRKIARGDLSNVCVVGDPKQSIYGFRDADVTAFEAFCEDMPHKYVLPWNYRARPALVRAVNTLCEENFQSSGLHYDKMESARESAMHAGVLELKVNHPADFARWLRGQSLEGTALLVRSFPGKQAWFDALASEGVKFKLLAGPGFWEDPRVQELFAFLRAWYTKDPLDTACFLRAPWTGVSDNELNQWLRSKEESLFDHFLSSSHVLAERLRDFQLEPVSPVRLLEILRFLPAIDGVLAPWLDACWAMVLEACLQGKTGLEVLDHFEARREEGERLSGIYPIVESGLLPVLTIHAAKGLEFDRVILLDFAAKEQLYRIPPLLWDKERGVFVPERTPKGVKKWDTEEASEWKRWYQKRALQESKRLFYVALTRAREQLIFVTPKEADAAFQPHTLQSDHWLAWIRKCAYKEAVFSDKPKMEEHSVASTKRTFRVRPQRPRLSATELSHLIRCPKRYKLMVLSPRVAEAVTEAQQLGTLLHLALEKNDWEPLMALSEFRETTALWKSEASRHPSLQLHEGDQVDVECAFEVPLRGQVLVGAIDRVVSRKNGLLELIDYKVSHTNEPPSNPSRYHFQMSLYAYALFRLTGKKTKTTVLFFHAKGIKTLKFAPFQPAAFEAHFQGLAEKLSLVLGGEAKAQVEKSCIHCPVFGACEEAQEGLKKNT